MTTCYESDKVRRPATPLGRSAHAHEQPARLDPSLDPASSVRPATEQIPTSAAILRLQRVAGNRAGGSWLAAASDLHADGAGTDSGSSAALAMRRRLAG